MIDHYNFHKKLENAKQKVLRPWWMYILIGLILLSVDFVDSVLMIRNIPGALQGREAIPIEWVLGIGIAFALTGSQLWLFGRLDGSNSINAGNPEKKFMWVLVILGVIINVLSNMFVILGGELSPQISSSVMKAINGASKDFASMCLFISAITVAFLVSFLPEFFLSRGWREKKIREVFSEAKQEVNETRNLY